MRQKGSPPGGSGQEEGGRQSGQSWHTCFCGGRSSQPDTGAHSRPHLPIQDLRLATEQAVTIVTTQMDAPLWVCALWRQNGWSEYAGLHLKDTAPAHPRALRQGYLELGPAAGAAELVDCAICLVVVTGLRKTSTAEAAGARRAWKEKKEQG